MKKPWVLSNILVVKELYESFAYSQAIEGTRNSTTARGHNLRSYTLMAHKRSKPFLRFRFYAFEDAERTT